MIKEQLNNESALDELKEILYKMQSGFDGLIHEVREMKESQEVLERQIRYYFTNMKEDVWADEVENNAVHNIVLRKNEGTSY